MERATPLIGRPVKLNSPRNLSRSLGQPISAAQATRWFTRARLAHFKVLPAPKVASSCARLVCPPRALLASPARPAGDIQYLDGRFGRRRRLAHWRTRAAVSLRRATSSGLGHQFQISSLANVDEQNRRHETRLLHPKSNSNQGMVKNGCEARRSASQTRSSAPMRISRARPAAKQMCVSAEQNDCLSNIIVTSPTRAGSAVGPNPSRLLDRKFTKIPPALGQASSAATFQKANSN